MIKGSLAKRYARALMSIGREQGLYERLGRELATMATQAETNEDFRLAVTSPTYSREVRERLIDGIGQALGFHELMIRFLKFLNEKGRMAYVPKISGAFEALVDEELGRVRAGVVTAAPLSAAAQNQLRAVLASITGREVIMDSAVDPEIIGGVVTRVAGKLFDGSVRTQLSLIEEKLKTTVA